MCSYNCKIEMLFNLSSRADIVSRIQDYNLYKDNKIDEIKHKEVNGRVFFEGILKLYWGLTKTIVLASGNSNYGRGKGRESVYNYISIEDAGFDKMIDEVQEIHICIYLLCTCTLCVICTCNL